MKLITESDKEEISSLESRLIAFYNTTTSYPVFTQPSHYPELWEHVLRLADGISAAKGACRILEVGAGRSGFGVFLKKSGRSTGLHLTSQDITSTNVEFLRGASHVVVTENIDRLQGSWDIIFHSYAYEHLCRPREFNEALWSRLAPSGYLLIQCPRYDLPFYFPPCFDHLPLATKVWDALRLSWSDLVSQLSGKPLFTIYSDPAVFYLPFFRDRDAVHRVRRSDLKLLFAGRAEMSDFPVAAGGLKDWIVKKLLTMRVILHKT